MVKVLIVSGDRTSPQGVAQNVGDALLTDALAAALRRSGASVAVADFGSTSTRREGDRVHLSGLRALALAVRRADLVVIGGGTLLQDDQPTGRVLRGMPRMVSTVLVLCKVLRTAVACIGVGCEPIGRVLPRELLRVALRGVPVWVRDVRSAAAFEQNFHVSAALGADVILLEELRAAADDGCPARTLVFALEPIQASQLTDAVVAQLREGFDKVLFLSMDQGAESDWASVAASASAFDQVVAFESTDRFRDALEGATTVIASRMHALYLAALAGVPALVVGEKEKTTSFAVEFGLPVSASVVDADPADATLADSAKIGQARLRVHDALKGVLDLKR